MPVGHGPRGSCAVMSADSTASDGPGDAAEGESDAADKALSEPIAQNISGIIELEKKELGSATGTQRWLEAVSRRIARPAYLIGLLGFVLIWIIVNSYGAEWG